MVLGENMGHEHAQDLSSLEPGVDHAAAVLTGGLAAGELSSVLPA
jgi:hypothetical protein